MKTTSPDADVTAVGVEVKSDALSEDDRALSAIVERAAVGDSVAWEQLADRFSRMVTNVARGFRLGEADVGDVSQATWLKLVENIDKVRQPERVGAWLATTARRESLRLVRAKARTAPSDDLSEVISDDAPCPAATIVAAEEALLVREAFPKLPAHCRRLLSLLSSEGVPSYRDISAALSMPVGSIGPTRGRCLEHLRKLIDELEDRRVSATGASISPE